MKTSFKMYTETYKQIKHFLAVSAYRATQRILAPLPIPKNTTPQTLTSSIVVPCCGKHVQLLAQALASCAQQTRASKEVVISISDIETIDERILDELERKEYPFILKIVRH